MTEVNSVQKHTSYLQETCPNFTWDTQACTYEHMKTRTRARTSVLQYSIYTNILLTATTIKYRVLFLHYKMHTLHTDVMNGPSYLRRL